MPPSETQVGRFRTWQQKARAGKPAVSFVEFELDELWTAALGFLNHDDELVLAEIRIFPTRDTPAERSLNPNERDPTHGGRKWGEWSWDPDVVPPSGLTMRTIRALNIGGAKLAALANVPRPGDLGDGDVGFVTASRLARARSDDLRRRRDPELLARVALLYDRAVNTEPRENPNDAIYEWLTKSVWGPFASTTFARTSVPGLVRAARAAGYLTPATKGRASGRASAAAHALVEP